MTAPKGRRRLSDAEIELWLTVARTVVARHGSVLPETKAKPAPPDASPVLSPEPSHPKFRTPFLPAYSPPTQVRASPQDRASPQAPLAPFEKRYRRQVTHGRVEIDGAIDLHGMTQPEAHRALRGFLIAAQGRGDRLVLVVTGKGRVRVAIGPAPERESGVLRRAVPQWLRADDLRALVMGFEEAGLPHGGLGALYVKLRKRA